MRGMLLLLVALALCTVTALWLDAPVMRFFARHYLVHQQPLQGPVYILWASLILPPVALAVSAVRLARGMRLPRETAVLALAGVSVGIAAVTADLLKPLFGRSHIDEFFARPPRFTFAFFNGDFAGTFPSGHAAMGFAYLAVLWHFYPRWRPLHAVCALFLMASLVVARDHFLSDVLAGAMLGAAAGWGTVRFATGSKLGASALWR